MKTAMATTQDLAHRIRSHSLRMVHKAKASHIGSALSIADILAVLYGQVMCFDPKGSLRRSVIPLHWFSTHRQHWPFWIRPVFIPGARVSILAV